MTSRGVLRARLPRCQLFAVLLLMPACALTQQRKAPESPLVAISAMVDEALTVLLPPGQRLSRVPIADRKIFFDHERTVAAFGHPGTGTLALPRLRSHTEVLPGSREVLIDCGQARGPCNRLGWGAYVSAKPESVTDSQAVVRVFVWWADRGSVAFQPGVAPIGRASGVGFSVSVYLRRSPDGRWIYEKQGPSLVAE